MRTNNVILIIILAIIIISIGIIAGMTLNNNTNNTNNTTNETTKTTTSTKKSTKNSNKKSSEEKYGDYIDDKYVSMSEKEYAERYPALYHERSLQNGKYDKYHPEFYEVDRKNGRI